MAHKKWIIADADKEIASDISEKLNIDPFLAFLFVSRGINDTHMASDFLSSSLVFSSPYGLKDMEKAVKRINTALDNGEKICIFGDYDCDGVTATALLYTFLESIGADVIYYIPNREAEGYGMNCSAIDKISLLGTRLVITVDNGIAAIDEAEYLYSLGMELIVTDHHQLSETLPKAEAIVNPHRTDNENVFSDLAGVGVAFKLVCAIYDGDVEDMLEQYSDLVAIGTVADVVPLVSENRGLVRAGLRQINSGSRIGIEALKNASGGQTDRYTATDLAFRICPRINAAGRLNTALRALELLLSDDAEDAAFRAAQLSDENAYRQELEKNILDDIEMQFKDNPSLVYDRVIVISGKGFHQGVVGIVAARITERFGKPAIVIGINENGTATGSARSIAGFNIFEAINVCSSVLLHCGGHPLAAGLGISPDKIDTFREKINAFAADRYETMPQPELHLDCKLSPFYLTLDLADSLSVLEPCGAENQRAVFGLFRLTIVSVTPIGNGKHIRITADKKGKTIQITRFGVRAEDFAFSVGERIDCAVQISKNHFRDKDYLSVLAVDIRLSGRDDELYFEQKFNYEQFVCGKTQGKGLYPGRDICASVYRFLKSTGGWRADIDDLYFHLQKDVTYGQLMFALEAFCEAGLIQRDSEIHINPINGKADLENTKVLKALKGRTGIE